MKKNITQYYQTGKKYSFPPLMIVLGTLFTYGLKYGIENKQYDIASFCGLFLSGTVFNTIFGIIVVKKESAEKNATQNHNKKRRYPRY